MAALSATSAGDGYDEELFVDQHAISEFLCTVCLQVAKDAHQTGCCGRLFCKACITSLKRKSWCFHCPNCRTDLNDNYFPDKISIRRIKSLSVYCTNKGSGCTWTAELQDLDRHLASKCPYELVQCSNQCSAKVQRRDLSEHLNNYCDMRLVSCPYCECEMEYMLVKDHQQQSSGCPKYKVPCHNRGCNVKVCRKDLPLHLDQCTYRLVDCPLMCGKQLQCLNLKYHLDKKCTNRIVRCAYCNIEGTSKHINGSHKDKDCQYIPVPCSNYDCKEKVKRGFMEEHLEVCPKQLVQCKYVGLCEEVMKREDEVDHYTLKMEKHLESAWLKLKAVGEQQSEHLLKSDEFHSSVRHKHNEFEATLFASRDEWNQKLLQLQETNCAATKQTLDAVDEVVDEAVEKLMRDIELNYSRKFKKLEEEHCAMKLKFNMLEEENHVMKLTEGVILQDIETMKEETSQAVQVLHDNCSKIETQVEITDRRSQIECHVLKEEVNEKFDEVGEELNEFKKALVLIVILFAVLYVGLFMFVYYR